MNEESLPDSEAVLRFPFASRRGEYVAFTGSLCGLALIEGIVFCWLVLWHYGLHPAPAIAAAIAVLLYSVLVAKLLGPLFTAHRIGHGRLFVSYGIDVRCAIPLVSIASVSAVSEGFEVSQALNARYDTETGRLRAIFAADGQILFRFNAPVRVRVGIRRRSVKEVLLNVDDPEEFIESVRMRTPGTDVIALSTLREPDTEPLRAIRAPVLSDSAAQPAMAARSERPAGSSAAIDVEGLSKQFGEIPVVRSVSFSIGRGEIYGFLGANGAGKTTTIKMMVGLLLPTAGRIALNSHDLWKDQALAKQSLGYVPDTPLLFERLTGREFLMCVAQLRRLTRGEAEPRISHWLDAMDLTEAADVRSGLYSLGMKRKLQLAAALLHEPEVLVLDEPLNGLDPRASRKLKDLLRGFAQRGTCIFFSTHDLAIAESICDRVGILESGQLIAQDTPARLRAASDARNLEDVFLQLTTARSTSP